MKYYKMIDNNTVIGAVSSDNFIRYQALNDCFLHCDETKGEYISYNSKLYRSSWMKPIVLQQEFTEVLTIEITQEEYDIFAQAIENNETIPAFEEEEEEIIEPEIEPTLEVSFIRESKIREMSIQCRSTIEAGIDLIIRGETKHFSLATQDQLNLMSLGVMAQTQSLIPYHADGEECDFYTAEEINEIIDTANAFKIYHTTYYNALKGYINSLETIKDIAAVTYGMEIPEEYQTNVLKALEA